LRDNNVEVEEIDYAKTGLSAATVEEIVQKAGSVLSVLNTRHEIAKEKGWATKPPSASVFAKAVAEQPNLIRRPILIDEDRVVIIGFDKPAYDALKSKAKKKT
jgi:arsenate reductase-like glutaredoxin family protein